jgi:dinuclear metal center YbgI/SA1388 family protein
MKATSASGPPVDREALLAYLDGYLDAQQGTDYCPNGLQVEGRREITKVVTGVSACVELFERAAAASADAILVHHGLFWRGDPRVLTGVQYRRVAALIRARINLIAYHLPLDRHIEVGNNAVGARDLGLQDLQPFCMHDGLAIGVRGVFPEPSPALAELLDRLAKLYGQHPLSFPFGPQLIKTAAFVSGGGGSCLHQAIKEEIDLFITGEAEEWSMNLAKEAGINFVAGGHYASERLGVQALGEHLRDRFGLEVEYIDVPNPV